MTDPSTAAAQENPMPCLPAWVGSAETKHGKIFFPSGDKYISQILGAGQVFCPGAEAVFDHLVRPGDVVVDVGANSGAFSVGFAGRVGADGQVFAIEPQLDLTGLITLSSLANETPQLRAVAALMSDRSGGVLAFPQPNLAGNANFGGIGFDVVDALLDRGVRSAPVPILALDDFSLDRLDLLKMDVEGYEGQVIAGARTVIEAHAPAIWGEADRPDKASPWLEVLLDLDYRCSLHVHRYAAPGGVPGFEDLFSFDLLALPPGRADVAVDHRVFPLASVADYLAAIRSWNEETGA